MHDKMQVRPFRFVNDEGTVECAVIRHTVAFLYIFQEKNVSNGPFVKPYVTIVANMCFLIRCYGPTIIQNGHGIGSFPDTDYKIFVAENVARRLVVKEEEIAKTRFIDRDVAERKSVLRGTYISRLSPTVFSRHKLHGFLAYNLLLVRSQGFLGVFGLDGVVLVRILVNFGTVRTDVSFLPAMMAG